MNTDTSELQTLRPRDFRSFLQEELISRCRRNPNYSLRSFAKALSISHSALTEMLNGKRPITKKSIEKLGLTLGLSLESLKTYQNVPVATSTQKQADAATYQQITIDQFAVISDWYHFSHTTANFARALGITKSEANIAVERLLRIGILEKNEEDRFIELNAGFATNISGNLTSMGSKKLQKQILEQSIEALVNLPIEVRNHTSMTMAVDPKLLPEAIERIKKFRRELTEFLETSGEATEVYQMSLSLFPITQIEKNKHAGE
jgi:uncharacterized protein (TIGR02147 family)